MEKYIIVIDQGTTSTRVILFDSRGNISGIEQKELKLIYIDDAILYDANIIYNDVVELFVSLLKKVNIDYNNILGVGITNQRETTVLWDNKTLEPVDYAICWQSTHTKDICDRLVKEGYESIISEKTGLRINPYFSASKISYILENNPNAKTLMDENKLSFGTIDSYLVARLTKGIHVTDYTNASRTMLFNIHTLEFDEELLNIFNINKNILPKVINSNEIIGDIVDDKIKELGNFKICSIIGDQMASLFGHTCFNQGDFKLTYGTGSFMLLNTSDKIVKSNNGLLSTIAYVIGGKVTYALEGSVFIAGSAFQFIKNNLELIKDYSDEYFSNSNNNVYFVPALTGLGAPYWSTNTRGAIFGLERSTTKQDIARATLEGVAFLNYDVFNSMKEDAKININAISVDGGASLNKNLMQFQADITNTLVKTISTSEATSLGCFYLVALATKLYSSLDEIKKLHKYINVYKPSIDTLRFNKKYSKWKKAIKAAIMFGEE